MRITRTRIIVACVLVASVGIFFFIRIVRRGPSTTVSSRRSLRAIFLLPKDLRQFPVEKYVKPGDSFVYHISDRQDGLRHCRLQIDTAEGELNNWKDSFRKYLKGRGELTEPRSGSLRLMLFSSKSSADLHGWVTFKGSADGLSISFELHKPGPVHRLLRTRFGKFLALLLAKIGYPLDAIDAIAQAT
jgi:hypothetical protein